MIESAVDQLAVAMSSLGKLPPIDVSMDQQPTRPQRTAEAQAALDDELDTIHKELGVQRGAALKEALKPKLECPMPAIQPATPDLVSGISCHAPVRPPQEGEQDSVR